MAKSTRHVSHRAASGTLVASNVAPPQLDRPLTNREIGGETKTPKIAVDFATGLGDGSHAFSATKDEHDAAVAEYLKQLRRQRSEGR